MDKLFYIIDDILDAPKWARHLEFPQDNMTLYIYGTEELFYYSYMPLTADVGFIEEQLNRIYDENVGKAEGVQKREVERWRK